MRKQTPQTKQGRQRGFTVVEAFVGITVLLVGIVGPLTLVTANMQGARFSRDQITASYLAQEAIETVRQVRDTNLLNDDGWLNGIDSCREGDRCRVDGLEEDPIEEQSGRDCEDSSFRLDVDLDNGEYSHGSGDSSRFWRCVWLENTSDTDHVLIHAQVIFDTGSYRQTYDTVGYMTKWTQ